jgi:putative N6-adenine-specific DNA methylase
MTDTIYPIFLACLPGQERALLTEARALGLTDPVEAAGGVETSGTWTDIWRANLWLRVASRVLVRIGGFPAVHLAQLDKRAHKFPWGDWLRADVPVRVEATSFRSKMYHEKAVQQRVATAITETLGATVSADALLRVLVRVDGDMVTFSLDTSGEGLHKRGTKQAVGKAPLRETMAAAFLREMGFDGSQPVLDPMCGSGTFVLEAAEIAAGLAPGRGRAFAFETLSCFDARAYRALCATLPQAGAAPAPLRFWGFDRDQGAITGARANAARAGLQDWTSFTCQPISALERPDGPPGFIMVNPPYGGRIGNPKQLYALYGALGQVLRERFQGWRLGMVTSEPRLAHTTGLKLLASPPLPHGGLKVQFFRSAPIQGV